MLRDCVNYEVNLEMCPCTSTSCDYRGYCCLCMSNHAAGGSLTACMKVARPDESLTLEGSLDCTESEKNVQFCTCGSTSCARLAVCCECVRNHWKLDGSGLTSCMRSA